MSVIMTNFLAFIFLQGVIAETVPQDKSIPALGFLSSEHFL